MRRKARGAMQTKELGAARRDHIHAAAQLIECPAHMAHQHLAFVGQVDVTSIALKERDSENVFEFSDGMTHRARRQIEHQGCRLK